MEKEFVPYELALKLKALGFDEPCFGMYCEGRFHRLYPNSYKDVPEDFYREVDVPTFSQAFRWFRENHMLSGAVIPTTINHRDNTMDYTYDIRGKYTTCVLIGTYEEAELACLDKLLEIAELKQKEDGK